MLKLISLNDLFLLQNFERVLFVGPFLRDKQNLAVASLPNHRIGNEVTRRHFASLCLLVRNYLLVVFDFLLELHLKRVTCEWQQNYLVGLVLLVDLHLMC